MQPKKCSQTVSLSIVSARRSASLTAPIVTANSSSRICAGPITTTTKSNRREATSGERRNVHATNTGRSHVERGQLAWHSRHKRRLIAKAIVALDEHRLTLLDVRHWKWPLWKENAIVIHLSTREDEFDFKRFQNIDGALVLWFLSRPCATLCVCMVTVETQTDPRRQTCSRRPAVERKSAQPTVAMRWCARSFRTAARIRLLARCLAPRATTSTSALRCTR